MTDYPESMLTAKKEYDKTRKNKKDIWVKESKALDKLTKATFDYIITTHILNSETLTLFQYNLSKEYPEQDFYLDLSCNKETHKILRELFKKFETNQEINENVVIRQDPWGTNIIISAKTIPELKTVLNTLNLTETALDIITKTRDKYLKHASDLTSIINNT